MATSVVLASPCRAFRLSLRERLAAQTVLAVLGDSGEADRLPDLVARLRPDLLVFDADWLPERLALLDKIAAASPRTRLLLCTQALDAPEVLSAVLHGVRGCIGRDGDDSHWLRVIAAVLDGDPWISRRLLVLALINLQRRLAENLVATLPDHDITERQRHIVALLATGLSNKEIALRLGISPATVKTHLHNIFERLGVRGRVQVLTLAAGRRSAG